MSTTSPAPPPEATTRTPVPCDFTPSGAAQRRQYNHARSEAIRRRLRVHGVLDAPCAWRHSASPEQHADTNTSARGITFTVEDPATGSLTHVHFSGLRFTCGCAPRTVWCEHILAVVLDMQQQDQAAAAPARRRQMALFH